MTKLKKLFTFLLIIISANNAFSFENKIILKINNEIITSLDVLNEIKYLSLVINDIENIEKKKLNKISLNSLTRQKIKEIELRKHFKNLNLEEKYLNSELDKFIKKNNFKTKDKFYEFIKKNNMDLQIFKKKISQEMLWNKLIYEKFYSNVKINKKEIEKNIKKNTKQNEYLLSEIFFVAENKNDLNTKYEYIKKTIATEGFDKSALMNSVSSTAEKGGLIGWIKESAMSQSIKIHLKEIKPGNFTQPLKVPGGFIILYVNDIRETKIKINLNNEINLIVREKTNEQLNQFSNIYFNKIKKNMNINEI